MSSTYVAPSDEGLLVSQVPQSLSLLTWEGCPVVSAVVCHASDGVCPSVLLGCRFKPTIPASVLSL